MGEQNKVQMIKKVIYPEYLNKFKCVGGKCVDICCAGWGIYVDKNTYEKYNSIKEYDVRKFITDNITIRKNCKNEKVAYGEIKLDKDNKCPFLDKENYCSIQRKYGEEYLSNVCGSFPRIVNKVNDDYEISLNISCIEAAKHVLLNKSKIKFIEEEIHEFNYEPQAYVDTRDISYNYANDKHMTIINRFCIEIIQNRKFNIYERLYNLGCALEYISNKLCYDFNNIENIINRCRCEFKWRKKTRDKMDYMIQISLFKNFLIEIAEEDIGISKKLKSIIKDCEEGFMFRDGRSLIEKSNIYMKVYSMNEDKINKEFSHIFENYIVNLIFQKLFPFDKSDIMINDYILLILKFSFIVFLCAGKYIYNKMIINEEDILIIMQSLSKEIEHSDKFVEEITNYLRKNDLWNAKIARTLL